VLPGNREIRSAGIATPVLGATGGDEAAGTVGSIMLAGKTLNMHHGDAPRGTRAKFHPWENGTRGFYPGSQPAAVGIAGSSAALLVAKVTLSHPRLALGATRPADPLPVRAGALLFSVEFSDRI